MIWLCVYLGIGLAIAAFLLLRDMADFGKPSRHELPEIAVVMTVIVIAWPPILVMASVYRVWLKIIGKID